jgi:hypothetical protein
MKQMLERPASLKTGQFLSGISECIREQNGNPNLKISRKTTRQPQLDIHFADGMEFVSASPSHYNHGTPDALHERSE